MNNMRLNLWKQDKEIKVKSVLSLKEIKGNVFHFYLGNEYKIHKIVDGKGRILEFTKTDYISGIAPYWGNRTKYIVNDIKDKNICIYYSGINNAQHTMLTEDILSVSGMSFWYPSGMEVPLNLWNKEVYIHVSEDYTVLNSKFIKSEDAWYYKPLEGEIFIVALKNYRYKQSGSGIIYYYFEEDDKKAEICVKSIDNLLNYFEKLYGYKTAHKVPIVSLPIDFNAGAYNIDNTIILNRFIYDYEDNISIPYNKLIHMLGHEIAHNWCTGAYSNWEDWLNETTAEWSSLSFLLENGYEKYVEDIINSYYENEKPESICTEDYGRPQQVHIKGTLLFYNIYKKYGLDIIKAFLKAFAYLEVKNTENWIAELNKEYSYVIPEIVDGLDVKLFK